MKLSFELIRREQAGCFHAVQRGICIIAEPKSWQKDKLFKLAEGLAIGHRFCNVEGASIFIKK